MSMTINNNISALKANRNLSLANGGMTSSIERLSSGYRINVGADDPSGLVISEQLRSQMAGLERAVRNSNEAYNLVSIAEGALNEMNNILKKMRSLAIHASNNGVTSPEQIEADQAELDSGIQTINRIANTTKYSDQYLLNGSKELVYDINTVVNDPSDHAMLDVASTRIDQVFKRDGTVMSIGFTGYKTDDQANSKNSAQRAYLEADAANNLCQINGSTVTAKQKFILTGSSGSKQFNFPDGTSLGTIVSEINNSKDSTGVGATLIFASNVRIDKTTGGSTAAPVYPNTPGTGHTGYNDATSAYLYEAGDIQIYGADLNNPSEAKISSAMITPAAANAFVVGQNCDGDGKIYAKVIDAATNSIEWYKDKDCTMLIGKGSDSFFSATNNSGIPGAPTQNLDGLYLNLTDKAENLDVYEIAVVGQRMDNQKDFSTSGLNAWADVGNSVMSGVNLGVNTSSEGDIYFRYTPVTFDPSGAVTEFKVEAFSDDSMEPQFLVATSGTVANGATVPQTVRIEAYEGSGLNLTMNIPSDSFPALPTSETTGSITFDNVGVRLYSTDYGSQETVRIQNQEGQLFYYYRQSDNLEKVMISGEQTVQVYGQDAQLTMNGTSIKTQGLKANTTTADFSGSLVFNGGKLGLTTMAVAGYDVGSLYSRAEALQAIPENEAKIAKDERHFEPPAISVALDGVVNAQNNPVNLYLDFTNLDPTVLARIDELGSNVTISATYAAGNPPTLAINASGLSSGGAINVANFNVDPAKLYEGFHSTEANLKGLFLRTDDKIDTNRTATALTGGATGTGSGTIVATEGDRLTNVMTHATNPRNNTTEKISNFLGGMQFQLGNTSGDQDRTVYSVQSMDIANLGRVVVDGETYTLQDVQGGGLANLADDPILAMKILEQAVNDVSSLRARLGAFQSNMLQTNINSLEVAVENITMTESAIRNTDMAAASTEFTKNQIMTQAGTSMLAQANTLTQNILTLLQ